MPSSAYKRDALLSVFAALTAAAYLFAYKRAGTFTEPRVLAYALLVVAGSFNGALALFEIGRGRLRVKPLALGETLSAGGHVTWKVSALLALLTISGNWCSANAVATLAPAVTSVMLRTEIVFVGVFAALFLREPLSKGLAFGAFTSLLGLAVMRWPFAAGATLGGTLWGLAAAASFGLMQVVTRRVIHRISPLVVNAVRLWLAVLLFSFQPGLVSAFGKLPNAFWPPIVLAGLLGPFVGRLCIMYSLRSLTAAHSALLLLLSPVFAAVLGAILGGENLTSRELLGGSLMILGIALPSLAALLLPRRSAVQGLNAKQ